MSLIALAHYYRERYPCDEIHAMLRMRDQEAARRDISAQFLGNGNVYAQKEYARDTADALRQTLLERPPESLHMGQMQPRDPRMHGCAEAKELVLDVDCTDYTRFCDCDGHKRVCAYCWLHIEGAVLLLQHFLTRQLGLAEHHLLWVFSGGKGVHCFVNARAVLALSDQERLRLHRVLHCGKADHQGLCERVNNLVTHHAAFLEQLEEHFARRVLRERDALRNERLRAFYLETLKRHFPLVHTHVARAWAQYEGGARIPRKAQDAAPLNESEQRWCLLQRCELQISGQDVHAMRASHYLMLRVMWPQVDEGPLRLAHRIKLPFSVHATTQNVALPTTAEQLLSMDPTRDALSFQELLLSRVPPERFTRGVALLAEWVTHCNT